MEGLKLFASNRLEVLAGMLAETLATPPASPLDKEIIVVQSRGMERWIAMELARRHGICANCSFPFPNMFIQEVLRHVVGDVPETSPHEPAIMTWKIMKLLPRLLEQKSFAILRNYLQDGAGRLKTFQLAERLADLFDQYLLFRPDMILAWETGQGNDWQALLWRELTTGEERLHRAALRSVFLEKIREPSTRIENLPERIAIFGISALPPFHMEVFHGISRFTRVNLFLMSPCREYWADIKSEREIGKITGQTADAYVSPEDLHLEGGNSLLASMGALGRDFFKMIQDAVHEDEEHYQKPGEGHLLGCIQSDILELRERDAANKTKVAENDRSITIHSCHSPLREIEVLYDHLLDLFTRMPDLNPGDILVMTPDIDAYASFIQAVFDAPAGRSLAIPYSITDRSIRKESAIIDSYLAVLELSGSRFEASRVLNILESKPLRRRFDLTDADLELIRQWICDTRIRWGIDAEQRRKMGFEGFSENSWRAGMDRLLLGYAMPGRGERMFHSILPYDDIEGSNAAVLGKLLEFLENLFADVEALDRSRTLKDWAQTLMRLLDRFFNPGPESEKEAQSIRKTLNDLSFKQDRSGFDEAVELDVILGYLRHRFETQSLGLGFITGGVTFCAMLPMRSIPFRVICLVGMNDGALPRQTRTLGFDLIARAPRPGDRSQRNDDRYLFLEALLSARGEIYLSYVGQSTEDNSPMPPSVLVSELLDVIEKGFTVPGKSIVDHITTKHRLQAFSPQYFTGRDAKYFSYSDENCRAALRVGELRKEPGPFIGSAIGEPEEEWTGVDVDQLGAFFANPARFLLTRRLKMQLETRGFVPEDREVFTLDALEQYLLGQKMLDRRIGGRAVQGLFAVFRAAGSLPHGNVGESSYDLLGGKVEDFFARIEPFAGAPLLQSEEVVLDLPPFRLTGRIDRISTLGLTHYRNAQVKARDRLQLWLRHLVLNALETPGSPRSSFLIGTDCSLRYVPVEQAREQLMKFLQLYWEGLTRPLHFFPRSSFAYARAVGIEGKSEREGLKAARKKWEGGVGREGEGEEPHFRLCFRAVDPLDATFQSLATEIFGPLLSHEKSVEG